MHVASELISFKKHCFIISSTNKIKFTFIAITWQKVRSLSMAPKDLKHFYILALFKATFPKKIKKIDNHMC